MTLSGYSDHGPYSCLWSYTTEDEPQIRARAEIQQTFLNGQPINPETMPREDADALQEAAREDAERAASEARAIFFR